MHQEAAFQEAAFIMARRVALEKLEEKKHLGGRLKRRDIRNQKAASENKARERNTWVGGSKGGTFVIRRQRSSWQEE